jgi:hypothetical protein
MVITRSTLPEHRLNLGLLACVLACLCFWVALGVAVFVLFA